MTLRMFHASFEEIPELHRALYVSDGERWRLDCDHDDCVRNLKTALRSERAARKFYERRIERFLTPDVFAVFKELLLGANVVARDVRRRLGKIYQLEKIDGSD